MLYGLLVVGILLVSVVVAGDAVESFDWAAVLTGLLGLVPSYLVLTRRSVFSCQR
ncbi:MAG: hypothetical protein V8R91_12125 [Butyricimonas faecihominis]